MATWNLARARPRALVAALVVAMTASLLSCSSDSGGRRTVVELGGRADGTDGERIVPLAGNITEIVFALGRGDSVVGRDITATTPEAAHLPLVTRAHDVSAESVLSLRPTLVIADEDTGPPEALEQIRAVGVEVVTLPRPSTMASIPVRIEAIADLVGAADRAAALIEGLESDLARVRAEVEVAPGTTVAFLYVRGSAGVYLLGGPGAGPDALIAAAGGTDAGTAMGLQRSYTPLTSEAMVQAAPDALLVTTSGLESVGGIEGLVGIPGLAQTPAGRDRRVISIEDGLLFSFSTRTPDAIRAIARGLA